MSLQTDNGCEKLGETIASDLKTPTIQAKAFSILKKRTGSILTLILIMSLAVLGIIIFFILLNTTNSNPDAQSQSYVHQEVFIKKEEWGGLPAVKAATLQHPTALVIISHTATRPCLSFQECIPLVKSAQNYHMIEKNEPDIGYNFLIGGDGSVFEGRGWDTVNFHRDGSVGICFIGNYVVDHLNVDMVKSILDLLACGVQIGKLDRDYVLVGHNQTRATLSPGANVYKIIKNWVHFNSSRLF